MTYKELLSCGERLLSGAGAENAGADALQLLLFAAGINTTLYLLCKDDEVSFQEIDTFERLVSRRAAREPLQYLLQSAPFLGREYAVGEGVLIPRPETEELAELVIRRIREKNSRVVFDLCAGTGCIGFSIALSCPGTEVYLFEKYENALYYLNKNVPAEIAPRVHIVQADILSPVPADLPAPDVIVSNPPYIASAELPELQPEVQREPGTALDGGPDGCTFYRAISDLWLPLLNKNGFAAFECGETQADALCRLFRNNGSVQASRDMFGNYRFITIEN
jgi:release factor glutamine methyltransferase